MVTGMFNLACPKCQCTDFYIRSTCTIKMESNFASITHKINSPLIPATFVYVCAGCLHNTQCIAELPVYKRQNKRRKKNETNSKDESVMGKD
jgi:hypothetical protein